MDNNCYHVNTYTVLTGLHMARITINQAAQDFNVSRPTLYKHVRQGKLSRDAEGKVDVTDLIALYGNRVNLQQPFTPIDSQEFTTIEKLKIENQQLKQLLAVNEMLVNQLQKQVDDLKDDKQQLFNQLEQRLIETKIKNKSFLGKFFK